MIEMQRVVYLSLLLLVFLSACNDDEITPISSSSPSEYYISYEINGVTYEYRRAVNNYIIEPHTFEATQQDSAYYGYGCRGEVLNGTIGDSSFSIMVRDYIAEDSEVAHFNQAFSLGNISYGYGIWVTSKAYNVEFELTVNGSTQSSRSRIQDASSYFNITNSEAVYNSNYLINKAISGNFSCYIHSGLLDSVKVENGHFKLPFGVHN